MIEVRCADGITGFSVLWVKKVVARTLKEEGAKRTSVSVLLTDNREIRRLNKQFLTHDYATDVISFGMSSQPWAIGQSFLGDIVVSVQIARSVSKELGIPFKEELARYLVHGTLHLLGYRDKKKKDKIRMQGRQEFILRKIF